MKRKPSERESFVYFVRMLEGKTMTLEGSGNEQVWTILATIVKRNHVSEGAARKLRLVYKGKTLDPEKTLEESGIESMSTIHIVGRLPSISCNSTAYRWLKHVYSICKCASLEDAYAAAKQLQKAIAAEDAVYDVLCVELDQLNFVQDMMSAVKKLQADCKSLPSLGVTADKLKSVAASLPITLSSLCTQTIANCDDVPGEPFRVSGSSQLLLQLEIAMACVDQHFILDELAPLAVTSVHALQNSRPQTEHESQDLMKISCQYLQRLLLAPLPDAVNVLDSNYLQDGDNPNSTTARSGLCTLFTALSLLCYHVPALARQAHSSQRRQLLRHALSLTEALSSKLQVFEDILLGVRSVGGNLPPVQEYLSRCSHVMWMLIGCYFMSVTKQDPCSECQELALQLRDSVRAILKVPVLHHICTTVHDLAMVECSPELMKDDVIREIVPLSFRVACLRCLQNHSDEDFLSREVVLVRQNLLESSFEQLMSLASEEMSSFLQVSFMHEEGEGVGVVREWLSAVGRAVFDPQLGLFLRCPTNPKAVHPSHLAAVQPRHLEYFEFAGRIVGLSMLHSVPLGVHLSDALFCVLPCHCCKLGLKHMEEVDPDKAAAFRNLLNQPDVDKLGLTFTTSYDEFGQHVEKPLVEGGEKLQVTDENKVDFVCALIKEELVARVEQLVHQFSRGLFSVFCGTDITYLFTLDAINTLLGGHDDISIDSWQAATVFNGWNSSGSVDDVKAWFWWCVDAMTAQQQRQLLQFWTALKSLPAGGFQYLPHVPEVVRMHYDEHSLPHAHTCFCQLMLPDYPSAQDMMKGLLVALENCEGYGMH